SLWLSHLGRAYGLGRDRGISDRLAMELYSVFLRDPTKADWAHDPLESLSSLVAPHPLLFERWFEVALARNEHERALEIADLARRHRFLSTLEMGGRLHSLRWVLEGPPEMLDQEATLQRQDLLVRFPHYGQLAERTRQIKTQLDAMPPVPGEADGKRRQAALLSELASIGQDQERLLRQIALERVPCEMVFPPKRTTRQVQQALEDGQAILVFFSTTRNLYAFLMTKDRYGYWPVASAGALPNQVAALLRGWGNYEQNKVLVQADLENQSWRQPAGLVLATLMKDSRANLPDICRELVVVPDGLLWYVPFEALEVSDGDATVPLISRMRLRYAPTLGLAIADPRPRRQSGNTAVVLGRLFPRDAAEVSARAFDGLASAVPGAVAVGAPLPAPAAVYAGLFDRLIAYRDTTPAGNGAYDWSPLEVDGNSAGSKLADWFALPWGGPDEVILPGFHTAAERSLKGQAAETAGDEMFLSVCGLMANGARTVLISRWRTGGQTSFDLVREFAQELPHTTAADAWQRSVLVVSDMPLDPALEPRLKHEDVAQPPKADHPFFWAGYMLIDTGTSPHVGEEDPAAKVLVQGAARRPDGQPPAQPAVGDTEPEEDEEDSP
ncbi:MAG: CHAT domain-containing protein, partial [Pirellulales bacterium]